MPLLNCHPQQHTRFAHIPAWCTSTHSQQAVVTEHQPAPNFPPGHPQPVRFFHCHATFQAHPPAHNAILSPYRLCMWPCLSLHTNGPNDLGAVLNAHPPSHNSAPHNTPHPLGVLPCLIAILEILHTVHAARLCISHKRRALSARAALSSCLCTFTPCLSPAPAPYGGPPPAHSWPAVHFPRAHRHATKYAHAPPFTIP